MATEELVRAPGRWSGTSTFRLMPGDEPATAPARARVSVDGDLVRLDYTWEHPVDGPQSGTLVIGEGPGATWHDTWHQADERTLDPVSGEALAYEYAYEGDWRWQIRLRVAADTLILRMVNVVPESARDMLAAGGDAARGGVGPYDAMALTLARD